jgi:hypothetical protein
MLTEPLFLIVLAIIALAIFFPRARGGRAWGAERRHRQQLAASQAWIDHCAGNFRHMEMICGQTPIGLDPDEHAVFVLPEVELLEPRAIRHARSTYAGPTIRLAKGLSLRRGSGMSQSESHEALRNIDRGILVLTTKRLVFVGSQRTNNVSLNDVVRVEAYADGIKLHRERKEQAETYLLCRPLQIMEGSGRGLTVFGPMVTAAIQLAKVFYENPEEVALSRREADDIRKSRYLSQKPGASPLHYGSLYSL